MTQSIEAPNIDVTMAQRQSGAAVENFIAFTSPRTLGGSTNAAFSFGTHALRPASGAQGDSYFETDRGYLYYYTGTKWLYEAGVNAGTDAARAAITVTADDNGALFLTTDTERLWRVEAGAWVERTTLAKKLLESGGTVLSLGAIANGEYLVRSGSTVVGGTPSAGASTTATYLTAQAEAGLSAEVNLGALASGMLKHTVAAGVSTPATATEGTDYYKPGGTDVAVADGGTGASTAANARTSLGLGNVDNTADTAKPVSTAQQTALDAKQQVLVAGWTTGIAASTTLYYWPGMSLSGSGTETARQTRMPACTLIGIRIHVGGAQSATGNLVITVRVNGAASAITKTVTAGTAANTDFDDVAHTVALSDGDKVSIEGAQGLGTGAANVTISLVYR